MRAKIKERIIIAKDTLMIVFDLIGEEAPFLPGQHAGITLINPPYNDEKGLRRVFSLVYSLQEKGSLRIAFRRGISAYKRSLEEVPIGFEVEIEQPKGLFTLPEKAANPLVFIAGGIGVTPFVSFIRYIVEKTLPYDVTLLYSNQTQETVAFFDELRETSEKHRIIKIFFIMTRDEQWKGEKRGIDGAVINEYVDNSQSPLFYIAGPPQMIVSVFKTLSLLKIDRTRIKLENFTGY